MSDKRFAYNPFTGQFFDCGDVHASGIYNKGFTKEYDDFIRGILHEGILYLRLYYPFDDIDQKAYHDILRASSILLRDNVKDIIELIKGRYRIVPRDTVFNVVNGLLKSAGLINI